MSEAFREEKDITGFWAGKNKKNIRRQVFDLKGSDITWGMRYCRATNATRVRPEDDSTYVTTLFELTGFEFLSSKVDLVRNVSWTSEMSVGRHIRSDDQIRSDQIRQ